MRAKTITLEADKAQSPRAADSPDLPEAFDLSILIVNWRSKAFVERCLRSIEENAGTLSYEVIVVDNASFDGCEAMIQEEFPQTVFLQSQHNLGFARANNLAFSRSRGRYVLYLNPDTEILGSALQQLLSALEASAGVGMVGARLLNSDLSLQGNCITTLPTISNQMLSSNLTRKLFPQSGLWGMKAHFAEPLVAAEVEAISGACMLVRREVIEKVQGLTTEYFMYCEDMDFCAKVRLAGWQVQYVPGARIVHHAGGSSAERTESDFSSIMIRESLLHFFEVYRGRSYRRLFRLASFLAASVRLLLLCAALPAGLHPRTRGRLGRGLRKWGHIWIWSMGRSGWAAGQSSGSGVVSTDGRTQAAGVVRVAGS